MTFDTFAGLLRQKLSKLGYKTKFDSFGVKFYLENYYDSTNLFNIEDTVDYIQYAYIQYAASPDCTRWTTIKDYSFINLKKLYLLAKQYYIDAKEKKIKDKLNEINKDFQ